MNNNVVVFIDVSHEAKQMMVKLSKDALKAGGKVVTSILKEQIPVKSGGLKKSIVAWAKIDFKTGQPYLDVGYRTRAQMVKKYGIKFYVNPTWFEFGTKPHQIMTKQLKSGKKGTYELHSDKAKFGFIVQHPGMVQKNFLRNTVMNNINEIQKAQEEKLSELNTLLIESGMKIDLGGDEEIE